MGRTTLALPPILLVQADALSVRHCRRHYLLQLAPAAAWRRLPCDRCPFACDRSRSQGIVPARLGRTLCLATLARGRDGPHCKVVCVRLRLSAYDPCDAAQTRATRVMYGWQKMRSWSL